MILEFYYYWLLKEKIEKMFCYRNDLTYIYIKLTDIIYNLFMFTSTHR